MGALKTDKRDASIACLNCIAPPGLQPFRCVCAVLALKSKGLRACFLGSAQTDNKVKEDAWAGLYTYIYMTPELAVNSVGRLRHLRDTKASSEGCMAASRIQRDA